MHQGLLSFFAPARAARPLRPVAQHWSASCGTPLTLRPVLASDAHLLGQLLDEGLSRQSRFSRFHGALGRLSPARLAWLADADFQSHVAFVVTLDGDGEEQAVAEGRWFRAAGSNRAEFALAVADRWQQQGLGGRLLSALLATARAQGLDELVGEVMACNQAMLALATGHQFQCADHPDGPGVVRAVFALPALSEPPHRGWAGLPWLH